MRAAFPNGIAAKDFLPVGLVKKSDNFYFPAVAACTQTLVGGEAGVMGVEAGVARPGQVLNEVLAQAHFV